MKVIRTDRDFPNVGTGLSIGLIAIIAPWLLAAWLGIDAELAWLLGALGIFRYPALVILYGGSFVIIGGVLRALCMIFGFGLLRGNLLIDRSAALAGSVLRNTTCVIAGWIALAFMLLRSLTLPLEIRISEKLARIREDYELWQRYRAEFYQAYASFAEFRRAFYGEGEEEQQQQRESSAAAGKSLEAAFALFGLQPGCTRAEFERRYRDLMKQVHPDRAGPNGMATQLNEACAQIRKRKGWK